MFTCSPELVLLTILMWNILCRNLQNLLVWKSLDSREYLPIPKFNKSIRHSQMFVSPLKNIIELKDCHKVTFYLWMSGISTNPIRKFKKILNCKFAKDSVQSKSLVNIKFIGICILQFRNKGENWFVFVYLYVLLLIHSTYHRFLLVYAPVASD